MALILRDDDPDLHLALLDSYLVSVPERGFVALIRNELVNATNGDACTVSVPERGFVALILRDDDPDLHLALLDSYLVSVPERGFVALIRPARCQRVHCFIRMTLRFQSPSGDSWL